MGGGAAAVRRVRTFLCGTFCIVSIDCIECVVVADASRIFDWNNSFGPSSKFNYLTSFKEIPKIFWIFIGYPRHCRVFGAFLESTGELLFCCWNYPYDFPDFIYLGLANERYTCRGTDIGTYVCCCCSLLRCGLFSLMPLLAS